MMGEPARREGHWPSGQYSASSGTQMQWERMETKYHGMWLYESCRCMEVDY